MANKPIRAIVITLATAIAGKPVKEGAVLLVPEDISEDTARGLMRMGRPRAKAASEGETRKRLAEYNKAKAERKEKEKAERKAAEAAAKAEADERAKALQAAEEKAAEIIQAAEEKAAEIIQAAEEKAKELAKGKGGK